MHCVTFIFLEIIYVTITVAQMYHVLHFVALRQRCEPSRVLASQHLSWGDCHTSDFSGVGGSYVNSCIKTRSTSAKKNYRNQTLDKYILFCARFVATVTLCARSRALEENYSLQKITVCDEFSSKFDKKRLYI